MLPYLIQPPQGLADWFVAKHTTDEALLRRLFSKYGFKDLNHKLPGMCRSDADRQTEVSKRVHKPQAVGF